MLVQRGTATIAASASSTTATLATGVDTSKAFIIVSIRSTHTAPDDLAVAGYFTTEGTGKKDLTFERGASPSGDPITIEYQVIEHASLTVQHGLKNMADSDEDVTITAVTLSKAFPIISWKATGSNHNSSGEWDQTLPTAAITTTTNLKLKTNQNNPTHDIDVRYQIVEFEGASVQRKTLSFGTTDLVKTASITAVTLNRSFIVGTADIGPDSDVGQWIGNFKFNSTTEIQAERGTHVNDAATAELYVVELPATATVQQKFIANVAAPTSQSITAVGDTAETFTMFSMHRTAGTGGGFDRVHATHKLTATTNVDVHVGDDSGTQPGELFVVELPSEDLTAKTHTTDALLQHETEKLHSTDAFLEVEPIFQDHFTDTGTPELSTHTPDRGDSWTRIINISSNLTIDGGTDTLDADVASGGLSDGALYTADVTYPSADYYALYKLVGGLTSDDPIYVAVRIQDSNNFYMLKIMSGEARLYKRVGGTFTALGTNKSTPANGSIIKLEIQGTTLKWFDDGVEQDSVTVTDHSAAGKAGLGMGQIGQGSSHDMSGQELDDFKVVNLGSTAVTKAHTTDTLLKAVDQTKIHTTDGLLQDIFTKNHTTGSLLQAVQEKTYTTDASLKAADVTVAHSTNALLRGTFEKNHTSDALLQLVSEISHTTDALLKAVDITRAHTTDSLFQGVFTKSHSTDAQLASGIEKQYSTDALLQLIITKAHTTDASLKALGLTVDHLTDALLQAVQDKSHSTDALLQLVVDISHTTNALLQALVEKAHTTDALLKAIDQIVSHTTDAFLQGIFIKSHSTDALLQLISEDQHTTDALLQDVVEKVYTIDGLLRATLTVSHSTDADLKGEQEVGHSTDADLKGSLEKAHSTDAVLKAVDQDVGHNVDALLQKIDTQEHTTDSLLQAVQEVTQTTDGLLRASFELSHNVDALLQAIEELIQTTDALLKKVDARSHTTDSLLQAIKERVHNSDTLLQAAFDLAHTTDALLWVTIEAQHSTDAQLRAEQIKAHRTDTTLYGQVILTHATDTYLRRGKPFSARKPVAFRSKSLPFSSKASPFTRKAAAYARKRVLYPYMPMAHSRKDASVTHLTDAYLVMP